MCLRQEKKSHAGPVEDKTGSRVIFFYLFIYLFIYFVYHCKDPAQTVRMHILIWNLSGHMLSYTPSLISCKSCFYCKDLDQQMYMHAHADLELCWSDGFICCKDPDQTVWMLSILSYQTPLIPHST